MGNIVSHYLILPNRILSYAKIIYFTLTFVHTFLFFVVRNAWRNACQTESAYYIQRGNEYLCTFSGDCFLQNKNPKQKRVRLSYTVLYLGMEP